MVSSKSAMSITLQQLKDGQLELGSQDLTHEFVELILIELNDSHTSEPPKTRMRNGSVFDSKNIRKIGPLEFNIWKINLAGNRNRKISDLVTRQLQVLPKTVRDLNLSDCGLNAIGVRNVCAFMESNENVTRLTMCRNSISDDGALQISDMIKKNATLLEFSCCTEPSMPVHMKIMVADGLEHNRTLRKLSLDFCSGEFVDPIVFKKFRLVLERAGNNSAIETLEIGAINFDANIDLWEETMRQCESLCRFGSNSCGLAFNSALMYYRALNMHNARKIIRDGDVDEFESAVNKASQYYAIDVVYFLIRNKVNYITKY